MQIRRDYSQPFFSDRRRRRGVGYWFMLLLMIAMVVAALFYIDANFPRLQVMALNMVGQGPAPTPYASVLAQDGYEMFVRGDVLEAASYLRQAVQQQPANVDYLFEYGRALLESESNLALQEAVRIGDQAIQANPRDPRGYAIKSRALDLLGESENAIPAAQQGLQVAPDNALLHAALASAYVNIARYDIAIDEAERAIELDPMDANVRRIYAFTLTYVGRYDEAITQLEEAIAINPYLTPPYFELASLARFRNDFEYAVATYEQVLTIKPGDAKANLRLCQLYIQIGQDNRAQGYCEDALVADPNYADARSTYGWVMYRRRNYEGAIEQFKVCRAQLGQMAIAENVTRGSSPTAFVLTAVGEGEGEIVINTDDIDENTIRCIYMRGLAHYYLNECDTAWLLLNQAMPLAQTLPSYAADTIDRQVRQGLNGVIADCSTYLGRTLPTPIPPTAIPPTPIGG